MVSSVIGRPWAHPRAGGENAMSDGQISADEGSSPRGRGKRMVRRVSVTVSRLIPARAGKTKAAAMDAREAQAHPRAGGEN